MRKLIADVRALAAAPSAPVAAQPQEAGHARDFLAWWTSIETDERKSRIRNAMARMEYLHSLLRTAYEAGQAAPTVPEGWINNPDSIQKPIIDACRDAIRKEFGNNGTDGYYKRILAKVFQSIAAAPLAPVREGGE